VVARSHGTEHGIASLGLTVTRSLQSDSSPGSPASSTAAAAAAHLSSGCSSSLSSTHRTSAFITYHLFTRGNAPSYLSQLVRVADLPSRRSLRSARAIRLLVPSVKLFTVGGRAFPVAGPTIWNSLPDNVISALSL